MKWLQRAAVTILVVLLSVLGSSASAVVAGDVPASVAPSSASAYTYDAHGGLSSRHASPVDETDAAQQPGGRAAENSVLISDSGVAAKTVDIGGAKFAQKSFSETFSKGGAFSGRTIDDVAGSLRSGAMSPKDVPIDVIMRDGNTLILNTRSSQALIRGGIPRGSWNVIDRTGQSAYEARLTGQLGRNGLTSFGTDLQ